MTLVQNLLDIFAFTDKRELLDPSRFDDEVALKVSWAPLVGGGSNFCTHRLQSTSGLSRSGLEFKTTFSVYLFWGAFISIALASLAFHTIPNLLSGEGLDGGASLIPIAFLVLGIWSISRLRGQESLFDRSTGQFTKGPHRISLRDVHALQLIREYISGKHSYYSYELNLVHRDGRRFNLTDHGSLRAIREDADQLGRYLGVPIWDAIDYRIPEGLLQCDRKAELLGCDFIKG